MLTCRDGNWWLDIRKSLTFPHFLFYPSSKKLLSWAGTQDNARYPWNAHGYPPRAADLLWRSFCKGGERWSGEDGVLCWSAKMIRS